MALARKIIILIILMVLNISLYGGGWPQPKGGYYYKLYEWWIVSDQYFDRNGDVIPNLVEYGVYTTALYLERGLTDRITCSSQQSDQ